MLLALLLVVAVVLAWALRSEAGARFVLARVQGAMDGKLSIERSSGAVSGPLVLEGIRWNDPASGVDARIGRITVDPGIAALFARRVQVDDLAIDDVEVDLATVPRQPQESAPFSLEAPVDIVVDKLALRHARVRQDGKDVFVADRLDAAAAWTGSGIAVRGFALKSPDGEVDLEGTLATADGWSGRGRTNFRWRVGGNEYRGVLDSTSDGRRAVLALELAAPFVARLDATLGQQDALPWTLKLAAPAFDLRALAKDSAPHQLALALEGSGDRERGALGGLVTLDGHRVAIEPLRFALAGDVLKIETLALRSPDAQGTLEAHGDVFFRETPARATVDVAWQDVVLPADLVGQELATHGKLAVAGSVERFGAEGRLALGPPGQPSDLRLKLNGTPAQIALETLALVQPNGGLDANGTITLEPTLGWQLKAIAKALDPGAFASGWPGALDFDLDTRGTFGDDGPDATLVINRLGGTLRERRVSGKADLAFKPGWIVDGTLDLASGQSTLAVRGQGGNATDVSARFDIASLGDWLPDAGGRANGSVRVHGRWPALDVEASAQARDLARGDLRVTSLDLAASVKDIGKPAGALTVKAIGVHQGDAGFDTVTLEANGNEAMHELAIDADGTPASLRLGLAGSAKDGRWNGTLKSLELDPRQRSLPDFALDAPMTLAWDGTRFTAGERCLVGTVARRGNADADAVADGDDGNPALAAEAREVQA
ncbi:MAG: pathogenicity protein, partial [Xanthomonadales bacterium]|nr:pathogenicity protein [Xanthomonadales bacterium]